MGKNKKSLKIIINKHLEKSKIKELHKNLKYRKKHYTKKIKNNVIKYSLIITGIYLLILYLIFFVFYIDFNENYIENKINSITNINQLTTLHNFTTHLNIDSKIPLQPINIIIISSKHPEEIFNSINWEKNEMFDTDNITLKGYFKLYKNKSLPISTNYLDLKPQDMGFQEKSNSNLNREHIKLWKSGYYLNNNYNQTIYFGSISYDMGIEFFIYRDFFVPLHEFDPNVDKSRDKLILELKKYYPNNSYYNLTTNSNFNTEFKEDLLYYTDGKIIIVQFE